MLCLSDRPGLIFLELKYCTFNMAAIFTSAIKIVCYLRLAFALSQRNTPKHKTKQLDITSITSNDVAGLRNGHVHVFTRRLQT